MPGTIRQISRSHVISRFRSDLLPSLHKVTQMRHTFRLKRLKILLIFICPKPRGPTELLKNAKNRFQIGFSYFQEGDTKTKIWSALRKRVFFSKDTLEKIFFVKNKLEKMLKTQINALIYNFFVSPRLHFAPK